MNRSLGKRLRKSLHYGDGNGAEELLGAGCSLPLTEVTVDLIKKTIANDGGLGELDVYYASHILHQASISPASIMIAVLYLERLKSTNADYVSKNTSSELFLISLVVASKFLFDKGENEAVYNDQWAEFSNFELDDLNKIEKDFLAAIEWACFVDQTEFNKLLVKFEGLVSLREHLKRSRGPLTYTESLCLFDYGKYLFKSDVFYLQVIKDFAQLVAILSVAYCAAVCILATPFLVRYHLHSSALVNLNHSEAIATTTIYQPSVPSIAYLHTTTTLRASEPDYDWIAKLDFRRPNITDPVRRHQIQFDAREIFAKAKHNKILKC